MPGGEWAQDLLPYLIPPALLGFLIAVAPGFHRTSTTVIAGMAAFVAFDIAWFALSIRRAARAWGAVGPHASLLTGRP